MCFPADKSHFPVQESLLVVGHSCLIEYLCENRGSPSQINRIWMVTFLLSVSARLLSVVEEVLKGPTVVVWPFGVMTIQIWDTKVQ